MKNYMIEKLDEEIRKIKIKLNEMIMDKNNFSSEEFIIVSRQLDQLIIKYYKHM